MWGPLHFSNSVRLESSFIQIPGIGERNEQSLWEAGITDWRRGVDTDVIGDHRQGLINEFATDATERLDSADVGFFAESLPTAERWRLAETFSDRWTALDIETTGLNPDRAVVTTVSLHDQSGTRTLVRDRDLTRERLQDELSDVGVLVTYNGARFDIPFLEQRFGVTFDRPHLDLMYPCRRLGWRGGLSGVERRLGLSRRLPDVDGREAVRLWHRYEAGDRDALSRLIEYNQEDTQTLFPILERVTDALDREVYRPYLP